MPIERINRKVVFFKAVDFGGSNRKVMKISTVVKPENYLGFYDFFPMIVSIISSFFGHSEDKTSPDPVIVCTCSGIL